MLQIFVALALVSRAVSQQYGGVSNNSRIIVSSTKLNFLQGSIQIYGSKCSNDTQYARDIVCEIDENGKGRFGITLIRPAAQIRV